MTLFDRLQRYVEFDDEDARAITDLTEIVDRHGNEIINRFYAKILETPETRAVLRDARQVSRLKETFRIWLGQLVLGPYDERYFEMRARIGRRHVEVGLPAEYMFAAMNVMRTVLTRILLEEIGDSSRSTATLIALGKILDLELAIMMSTYQDDLIDKWRQRDREASAERIQSLEATAAGLAHEIGNPLNAVGIHIEILKRRLTKAIGATAKDLDAPIETIADSFRRIQHLVREFQDYSRGPQLSLKRVDLADVVGRLVDEQRPVAEERHMEIRSEILARPAVLGDSDKLHQVFLNLTANALEAMTDGGRLDVSVRHDGVEAVVLFRDTGPGIPPEDQTKIFSMFYSTKGRKSGLGLAISERIVLAHGGRITVQSQESSGSTFGVRLPVA